MENKEQDPCIYCGKPLREQLMGCDEASCYRQYLSKTETHDVSKEDILWKVWEEAAFRQKEDHALTSYNEFKTFIQSLSPANDVSKEDLEAKLQDCKNFIAGACYEDIYDEARAQQLLERLNIPKNL